MATFLAVVQSRPLQGVVDARFVRRGVGGDIVVANAGTLDAPAPMTVRLDAACRDADAVSGYQLRRQRDSLQWVRTHAAMLRAGAVVNIGWVQCDTGEAVLETGD